MVRPPNSVLKDPYGYKTSTSFRYNKSWWFSYNSHLLIEQCNKTNKDASEVNYTICQMGLTNTYGLLYWINIDYALFSGCTEPSLN